jgi:hypothetical protein
VDAAPKAEGGIASAVINTSHQIGGVVGVALPGDLVHTGESFVSGLHIGLLAAAAACGLGAITTALAVMR